MTNMIDVEVDDELKKSFIAYAMAVNVSRAIPDVRDGLKPVHRRILYSMHEMGFTTTRHTANARASSAMFWVNTTRTAISPSMTRS